MVINIQEALKKSNIDVTKLLIKLKSSAVRDRQVPLFDPGIFEKVSTIDKLFETLSKYWELFDYDVLMYLVNTAECEAAIKVYDEFLTSFDSSVMSNYQLILHYRKFNKENVLPGTYKLRVKIAQDKCTAEIERKVKGIISEHFKLEKYALILKGIKQGCCELIYQISPSVKSYMLEYKIAGCDVLQLKAHMITVLGVDNDMELIIPHEIPNKVGIL